jgi:putative hydrolase of the HAD superfamily
MASIRFGLVAECKAKKWVVKLAPGMKSVVTFDAAGTLIRLTQSPGTTYAEVARTFGYDLDPDRVEAGFRKAWKALPARRETHGPRPDDDKGWWFELVAQAVYEAGYKVEPLEKYFEELYRVYALSGAWELFPDAAEVLDALAANGIRLGIVSNFDRRLYDVLEHVGIRDRFEHILVSSEVGSDKPAAGIFLEAARRFAVTPEEILHVGDDPKLDGAAAKAAGCAVLIVDHRVSRLHRALEGA